MLKRLLLASVLMLAAPSMASQFQDANGATVNGVAIEDVVGNRITPLAEGGSVVAAPLDGAYGAGSASAAAVFSNMPISTAGYNSVYVQITGVGVGTTVFEQSLDLGTTWSPVYATPVSTTAAPTASVTSLVVGTVYSVAATGQFRMRLSSYTSGTFAVAWVLKNSPRDGGVVSLTTQTASNLAVKSIVGANGGSTITRVQSAATTNATSVKASAGQLYHCPLYNNGAAVAYVKFYNKASAPTVGTDTPVAVIGIAPSGSRDVSFADVGAYFGTGIAYAITGGAADSDTTAVAAAQVVGACTYN